MAWDDRIREGAYTSPSGTRYTFTYEDVSRSISKKTSGFDFPDVNGTLVQDLGHTGRKYPLRCIFWGENYDIEANAFEEALAERGFGRLEHPVYGPVDVVPYGDIVRNDNLKTEANQAIIEVTFWETIGIVYPTAQIDKSAAVLSTVEEFNTAVTENFEEAVDVTEPSSRAILKGNYEVFLAKIDSNLGKVAAAETRINQKFNTVLGSITVGLDTLIGAPLTLAAQTIQLMHTPARVVSTLKDQLNGYKVILLDILEQIGLFSPGVDQSNEFQLHDLISSTCITGEIISVVSNEFFTKKEALETAEIIYDQFGEYLAWREENYQSLQVIDTGAAYQALQKAVALTLGYLVEISFTLKQEKTIILDRNRTIIDLAAEIYGEVDSRLDFLINSNDFSGSEILELPRGRKIVYYI